MSKTAADRSVQVETILRQVDRLPTLSPVAARLLEITDVDDADLDEIIRLIETDVSLSATVIKLVRSAERGLGDRIKSVRQAIMLLGLESVRAAVLSVEVLDLLQGQPAVKDLALEAGFDNRGYWKHAVAVACGSEIIARERGDARVAPEMAFLAGLLHGLGQLVLHLVLPHAYDRALSLAEQKQSSGASVERAILGIDHYTVGRRLADRWGLPDWLRDVIWFHGQPSTGVPDSSHRELVAVVSLSRAWCQRHHLGWSGDFCMPPAVEPLAESVGMQANRLPELVPALLERLVERESILELDSVTPPEALLQAIARANQRLGAMNATLEGEARAGRRRQATLRQTAVFLDRWRCEQSMEQTHELIGASAMALFDAPRCAIIWRCGQGADWRSAQFQRDGQAIMLRERVIPTPATGLAEALASGGRDSSTGAAAQSWLSAVLDDRADAKLARLIPLVIEDGIESVLVVHADLSAWNERTEIGPVRSVWCAALRTVVTMDRSRGLEDELASVNRALAESQSELTERDSMARLGEMTAGAAHEMNNPLAVIRGRAQMLSAELEDTELSGCAQAIVRAATDMSELITELNRFASMEGPTLALSDLSEIAASAAERAGERIGEHDRVEIRPNGSIDEWTTDRELLTGALCELIVNALEAGSPEKVVVETHFKPGDDRLYVRVVDDGCGLSERAQRHAFDPFFSEKPAGRQRGLGLAKARRSVELLGGRITLEGRPGGGTIATIVLFGEAIVASAA